MDSNTLKTIQDMMGQFMAGMEDLKKVTPGAEISASGPLACLQEAFNLFRTMVTKELDSLSSRMTCMELRQEKADLYSRRNCLLFRGLEESGTDDESSCLKLVMRVIKDYLKLELSEEVVERCHRLGARKQDYNRPIIVKFYSYRYRREVFGAKKALAGKRIVITEFLTQGRMEIFMKAREIHGARNVWTADGKVFIKDGERRHVVTAVKDIPVAATLSAAGNTPVGSMDTRASRRQPQAVSSNVTKPSLKPLPAANTVSKPSTRSDSATGRKVPK